MVIMDRKSTFIIITINPLMHAPKCLREGVKKTIDYRPVRKRGVGANPLAVTNIAVFSEKEKKMQNVLKRKNMQNIL